MTNSILFGLAWIFGSFTVVTTILYLARRTGPIAITALFVGQYVASAVLANKLILLFGCVVPAGTIIFSMTFLMTDMLCEFYGREEASKAVWLGFFAQILLLLTVWAAIHWPSPPFWDGQDAFVKTLGNTWRIVLGSMAAYLVSQHHDVFAYSWLKRATKGKHLWLRNNAATTVSQTLDSIIFTSIAFGGIAPIVPIIKGTLIVKIIIALCDTPFLYFSRWFYYKQLGGVPVTPSQPRPSETVAK